jgi:hypothetical protein
MSHGRHAQEWLTGCLVAAALVLVSGSLARAQSTAPDKAPEQTDPPGDKPPQTPGKSAGPFTAQPMPHRPPVGTERPPQNDWRRALEPLNAERRAVHRPPGGDSSK